ncbi:lanthionine synthetase C family protein [Longispora sp. NPDC051575]|uniref:lanthionine synthetase C family protein n=1 Tax=Longispora sp. NPDC051575 TaxID=3154943 RepID=UPI00343AFC75
MTALPLLSDHPRLRAAASTADRITTALAAPPEPDYPADDYGPASIRWHAQSLSKGAAGVAVLHGVRAQTGHGDWEPVRAWLGRATADDLANSGGAGLWYGAPAVAHALATAAPGARPNALAILDRAVADLTGRRLAAAEARLAARARPPLAEFDLVRGLTGLGAHLLRRDPDGALVRRVLAYLVRLTEPVDADDAAGRLAPGWWTAEPPDRPALMAGGHANLGMAHGIGGPLALLALAHRDGVTVAGHTEAIGRICATLDGWRQIGPAGPWWPERIPLPDLLAGAPAAEGPARPSWCYGTPGLARAQQLAGIALRDPARQQAAEDALTRCLADPAQLDRITDPAVCHGWAGLAATVWYAANDARSSALAAHLPRVLNLLLRHAADPMPGTGLIEGSAGVALVLHMFATGTAVRWATSLLID